jgi:hypothetical protein
LKGFCEENVVVFSAADIEVPFLDVRDFKSVQAFDLVVNATELALAG